MTRGQIAIITDKGIETSIEFNGDMYYSGNGKEVIKGLKKVNTVAEYESFVEVFNETHHDYDKQLFYYMGENTLDFSQNYFDNWFSDYLYIKNISSEDKYIIDDCDRYYKNCTVKIKRRIKIASGGIITLNFGKYLPKHSIGCEIDEIVSKERIENKGSGLLW